MMKKILFKIFILSTIVVGCHKNCPKPGDYQMTFIGTYEISGSISTEIGYTTISETTKDYFFIGDSKIDKEGKKISGEICCLTNYSWVKLDGKCQKKKGKDYLSGTYKAGDYGGGIINGEFEIKSQ